MGRTESSAPTKALQPFAVQPTLAVIVTWVRWAEVVPPYGGWKSHHRPLGRPRKLPRVWRDTQVPPYGKDGAFCRSARGFGIAARGTAGRVVPPYGGAGFRAWVLVAPSSVTAVGRDTFPPRGKAGRSRAPPLRKRCSRLPFGRRLWDCGKGYGGPRSSRPTESAFSGRGWLSPPHPSRPGAVTPSPPWGKAGRRGRRPLREGRLFRYSCFCHKRCVPTPGCACRSMQSTSKSPD